MMALDSQHPPLVRIEAAEALGKAHLDAGQLKALAEQVGRLGVLEVPKLVWAFERSNDPAVGEALVAALGTSPGLKGLRAETIEAVLQAYPESVRHQAEPLYQQLTVDLGKQKARLAELKDVLAGGDIQRGRDLFFGNKKADLRHLPRRARAGGQIRPRLEQDRRHPHQRRPARGDRLSQRQPRPRLRAVRRRHRRRAGDHRHHHPRNGRRGLPGQQHARGNSGAPPSIESLQQATVSIMPEGMEAQLSRQELGRPDRVFAIIALDDAVRRTVRPMGPI